MNISKFTFYALVVALLVTASSAVAYDELELRDKWSKSVAVLKDGVCKGEDRRKVVKKIDYAAILIVHNELEEARMVLDKAAGNSKSEECKKAIEKGKEPPKTG